MSLDVMCLNPMGSVALIILPWTLYIEQILRSPVYSWGKSLSFGFWQIWHLVPPLPLIDWVILNRNYSVSRSALCIIKSGDKPIVSHVVRIRDCFGNVPGTTEPPDMALWSSRLSSGEQVSASGLLVSAGPSTGPGRSRSFVFTGWMTIFQRYAL